MSCIKNKGGVTLKLDFEKTYDKVNWPFVQRALRMKGFSLAWCRWIEQVISRGSVGVRPVSVGVSFALNRFPHMYF
jgi:hypothetical protein